MAAPGGDAARGHASARPVGGRSPAGLTSSSGLAAARATSQRVGGTTPPALCLSVGIDYLAGMARLALDPAYRRVTVREFLHMDFGGARAGLEDGFIYIMAGGTEQHARIAGNIFTVLLGKLRGSGCRPCISDLALQTADFTA